MGHVKFAADITVGGAGAKGAFTARALDADIPAVLRRGASEALGGRLDFFRAPLRWVSEEWESPSKSMIWGAIFLSVANFGRCRGGVERSPNFSASIAEWAC